ncbi:ERAD-associated E3 ubiquitin-protein ligase HRD1 [Candida viswanathii]|uniref:RING-type E3 ubiquitin transferase n=1 Tax=Candida viswanathii TaxID=5486 RepID=A0A367XZR2_9ASCO|nr:ERAD-associated E3 ubiquitin-protein ligase HRD1 [Candida viswanathii]
MLLNKTQQYIVAYSAITMALLSWSIYDSLSKSYNFVMFIVEFTDGMKLGILINFIVFLFLAIDKVLQVLIFGSLRMIEIEHLFEKLPIFAINLLLNLTTGDNNMILNVFLMGLSISFKVFHIIMFDRLDYVNVLIVNKINNHDMQIQLADVVRHFGLLINFWLNLGFIFVDFGLAKFLVYDVFQGINSVTCLLFGFQFAVQGVNALTYFAKLSLGIYEIVFYRIRKNEVRRYEEEQEEEEEEEVVEGETSGDVTAGESGSLRSGNLGEADVEDDDDDDDDDDDELELIWESKPYYSKGVEIASSALTSISYLSFLYLLTIHSGLSLPLSMLQGTYSSMRKTWIEVTQLLAFIEKSKRLDTQLANANRADLEASDNLCIICREDMHSIEDYQRLFNKPQSSRRSPKKLKCGHILHLGCLKDWLERSDSCPLCRRKVFEEAAPSTASSAHVPPAQAQPQAQPVPPVGAQVNVPNPPVNADLQRGFREINEFLHNNHPPQQQEEAQQQQAERSNPHSHTQTPTGTATPVEPVEGSSRDVQRPIISEISSSSTSTDSSASTAPLFQSITLPSNVLLPPGWLLLPLEKPQSEEEQANGEVDYKVNISNYHKANMKLKPKESNTRNIKIYDVPKESPPI